MGTWYQQEFGGNFLFDPSSNLYTSLTRTYNPTPARWLSPDPAGNYIADPSDPQTWNFYAYVRNNPTTYIDPLGLLENCPNGVIKNNECIQATPSEDDNDDGLPWADTILYAEDLLPPTITRRQPGQ